MEQCLLHVSKYKFPLTRMKGFQISNTHTRHQHNTPVHLCTTLSLQLIYGIDDAKFWYHHSHQDISLNLFLFLKQTAKQQLKKLNQKLGKGIFHAGNIYVLTRWTRSVVSVFFISKDKITSKIKNHFAFSVVL